VGQHSGAYAFTVGQRRGLRLGQPAAGGEPRYVAEVQPETNTVVVAAGELLGVDAITGDHARWCGPAPQGAMSVGAQVRAHGQEVPATAWAQGDQVEVRLEGRFRGVSPGQSVVLYDGTRVVGSATITMAAASRTPTAGSPAAG
jgi:tRNA-specific 2-thiouridylase